MNGKCDFCILLSTLCNESGEEIENPLTQKVRYPDKLVDDLAKGKAMEKILRKKNIDYEKAKITNAGFAGWI